MKLNIKFSEDRKGGKTPTRPYKSTKEWFNAQIDYLNTIRIDVDHFNSYLRGLELLYGESFRKYIEKELTNVS